MIIMDGMMCADMFVIYTIIRPSKENMTQQKILTNNGLVFKIFNLL